MRKTLCVLLFSTLCQVPAFAAGPNLFTYQGRLKEGGLAVTGNRAVEIFLCDAETGPTCTTTQPQPVAVANGLFRSTFTIPASLDLGTGGWWLEIKVGADTLSPRERLTSNAYALFAATAAYAENISAAPGANGVYISSNLYITGGGKIMGDGSGLTSLPAAALTGALPAIDGSALSGVSATVISDNSVSTGKLQDGAVTLPKLENVVDGTLLGNNSGAAGPPLALTAAQAKALLGLTAIDVGLGNVSNVAQLPASYLDTDSTLAADSDAKVPSQKAAKAYIDTGLAGKETADATIVKEADLAAADFNVAGNIVSLDYANGQAADGATKGFLTAGDWSAFSGKLSPNGDGSALAGVAHLAGDEGIDGLKVFGSSLSVNNSMLLLGNYALMLSSNPGYGGGLRHDQSGNETLVMAVRNANSKIYLATAYDVSVNAGGGLSLPATPELTVYSGKVGVNKPAPGYALDVSGQVNASAGLCIGGTCKASWTYIDNLGDHTATQALNMANNQIVGVSSATLGGPLTLYGSSVTLRSAGATKFAVDTNGHVGVNAAADSASGVNIYGSGIYDAGLKLDYGGLIWAIHNNNGVLTFTKTDGATTPQLYLLRSGDLNVPNGALLVGSTLTVKNQLVGINNAVPSAALDVKSTGTLVTDYAQIWRNSGGTVVASVTATGAMSVSGLSVDGTLAFSTVTAQAASGLGVNGIVISTNIVFNTGVPGGDNFMAYPFIAGGTISAKQAVILSADNTVNTTTTLGSTSAIGFAVTSASIGETVWVATSGTVSGVVADGAIALGALVKTATTSGRVVTSGGMSGCNIGVALKAAAGGGSSITVLLTHE